MDRQNEHNILLDSPAKAWQQGFLLGNGFMGQVLYGQPYQEVVELSESTFFSGSDTIVPYREGASEAFVQMRLAAEKEDWERLTSFTNLFMGERGNYGTNLPVGKLCLTFKQKGNVTQYRRLLNLDKAVAQVEFTELAAYSGILKDAGSREGSQSDLRENKVRREAFSSHTDRVFALLLEENSAEGMSFSLAFDGGEVPWQTFCHKEAFGFRAQALENIHSDGSEGVRLVGMVYPQSLDGYVEITSQGIRVEGSHKVVLYLAMDTDYSLSLGIHKRIEEEELYNRVRHTLFDYSDLKESHIRDISGLMSRQRLTLGRDEEESAGQVRSGGSGLKLTELMFQYGRYLLVCSSREDSLLPAHLQGVWNDNVACRIGWTCDMHLDINTQMNYWISEAGNLQECHMPVFNWMENRLIPNGRKTAKLCYGRPGWVGELVSNAWGYAAPYWDKSLSPCPTGGIWQASDFMEHYRFGQDIHFLQDHAYPVLKEAVEFFLTYLFEDGNGMLTSGPSISPENSFLVDGKKYYASNGCTYEILMIRELFTEFLEAWEQLNGEWENTETAVETAGECENASYATQEEIKNQKINPDRTEKEKTSELADQDLAEQVKDAIGRLLPYRILNDGTVAEWSHNYPSADPQHRHTSHLLGLFPYGQITPRETPQLSQAAQQSVAAKLTPYENWEDTGWARSMLMLYSARLQKGEEAYRHLKSMQENLTGPNLLVMHPPTRGAGSFMEVYELDGNTGFTMTVLEMLVQSHNGVIRLLPALPQEWCDGCIEGVSVRGGLELNLKWKDSHPVLVNATAHKTGLYQFAFGNKEQNVKLKAGIKTEISFT